MAESIALIDRAVEAMVALHRAVEPMENTPDIDGRVPAAAMRAFVDALADIDRERCALKSAPSIKNDFDADLARLDQIRSEARSVPPGDCNFLLSFIDKLWAEYSRTLRRADETTTLLDSPWVKVSERKPTQAETDAEPSETVVAYLIDGEWSIDSTMYKPECWGPPHMRTPDYWTFASRIAPSVPVKASEPRLEPNSRDHR